MTTATAAPPADKLYTTADLLAMPDDGIERWLIDGRIHEFRGTEAEPVTMRNKHHSRLESRVCHELESWLDTQPTPRGSVHAGEVGVRLRDEPDLTVGIDVVYLSPDLAARTEADHDSTIIVGVPILAVEIHSPHNTVEEIHLRRSTLLGSGIPLLWFIDPYQRTVTVFRPRRPPEGLNEDQTIDGGAELPGLSVPVARLFRR